MSDIPDASDWCSCGVALEGRLGQAYNEEAFRHFLAIERKRSERTARPFLLLLVDVQEPPGVSVRIEPAVAKKLFSGLWLGVRETDFIGWYSQEHVAGAVLTELGDGPGPDVFRLVGQRLSRVLREGLPSDVARRVRVHGRVHPHPEPEGIVRAELVSGDF